MLRPYLWIYKCCCYYIAVHPVRQTSIQSIVSPYVIGVTGQSWQDSNLLLLQGRSSLTSSKLLLSWPSMRLVLCLSLYLTLWFRMVFYDNGCDSWHCWQHCATKIKRNSFSWYLFWLKLQQSFYRPGASSVDCTSKHTIFIKSVFVRDAKRPNQR